MGTPVKVSSGGVVVRKRFSPGAFRGRHRVGHRGDRIEDFHYRVTVLVDFAFQDFAAQIEEPALQK